MIKSLYNNPTKRIIMRFTEIFLIGGTIALLDSPELINLIPPIYVGIIAAFLKMLRELKKERS